MTVHQCPKCELRFSWQTELDDHCRTDHPAFQHEYPVAGVHHDFEAEAAQRFAATTVSPDRKHAAAVHEGESSAPILSTYWNER